MKICFVVPYVPSPIRVRPYNLIRSLLLLGHKVTVVAILSGKQDAAATQDLRDAGAEVITMPITKGRSLLNCVKALVTNIPLQAVYSWRPGIARFISKFVFGAEGNNFDVVHVEHLRGSRYGLYLKRQGKLKSRTIPIVWDSVDCISLLFRQAAHQSSYRFKRLLAGIELKRTENYEAYLLRQFRSTLVTSSIDKQALLSLPTRNTYIPEISVLPNGVDLNHFCPDSSCRRERATLVVSGKMSYHANVTMVSYLMNDIMPLIWAHRPDVKVIVTGSNPTSRIRAFANHPQVEVTGTVSDMRPYLLSATIAVAPVVYGAGIQNKVMEAMACETPVITTPKVIQSLQAEPGRDLLIAEKPEDFAAVVIRLLEDEDLRHSIGRAGRLYVEKNCQWKKITAQLVDTYIVAIRESEPTKTTARRHRQ